MVADIVGYSRLIGIDEAGTLRRLKALRRVVIDPRLRGPFAFSPMNGLLRIAQSGPGWKLDNYSVDTAL